MAATDKRNKVTRRQGRECDAKVSYGYDISQTRLIPPEILKRPHYKSLHHDGAGVQRVPEELSVFPPLQLSFYSYTAVLFLV